MMYCMSVSHKKAPVNIREQFSFGAEEKTEFIKRISRKEAVTGVVVLCTCNRSEIYVSGEKNAIRELQQEVADFKQIRLEKLLKYLNIYSGESAIGHLFKVACGFDSMVLGEDEILGQVKDAYQISKDQGAVDYELNVLFQKAVTSAKRIKTDTNLSRTPLSIATLVANEVFHFEKEGGEKKVMVIGMTGKMGNTITKNILSKPGIEVIGTVRSHKSDFTLEVKSDRVKIIDYKDRYRYMDEMDIVISATLGPHYTVTYEELSGKLSEKKKRLFIDVAVPVDMDPAIRKAEGLTLYDIDYFETLSKNNTEMKLKELDRARAIMEEDLDGAVKEVVFHPYIRRMDELKETFSGKRLDTLLYQIRDHVSSEELKVVLKTLDGLENWIKEG
ncbi:glutamyl-tRNA reductase [Clostridium sp. Marseille-P2415]|uniref:glutamyl-tRNA reductase n=1 Tax=Clostridium sp. Marseille-P2415 TaxID=1805471 RepID=UPI001F019B07|nr:glutamyl-tRNA reductase [Clostridium sp. Marseille-P2415]